MGTGWAVGSAALLGLCAAIGFTAFGGLLFVSPFYVMVFASIAAFATWAYAMVRAVHGGKGALVAVLAHDVVLALQIGMLGLNDPDTPARWWSWLILALGAVAAVAVVRELRARRGGIEWRTALALSASLLPFVGWSFLRLVS